MASDPHPFDREHTRNMHTSGNYCKPCASLERKTRRDTNKAKAISYPGGKCTDCGEEFIGRPEVFDFDHLGDKSSNISSLLYTPSWLLLELEIRKCELVCANCHRTRTSTRLEAGASPRSTRVAPTPTDVLSRFQATL